MVLLALASCAFTTIASADASALRWPTGALAPCPDRAWIEQRIASQLGAPVSWRDLSVSARVERIAQGYRIVLSTVQGGERATRTFESPSCQEASAAAALLIALMLDQAEPGPRVEPMRPPSGPAREPARPPPAPAVRRRARALVRFSALGEAGFMPRPALGGELTVGLSSRDARLELSGLFLPRVHSERAADGARVGISLWTARAGYCHRLLGRRVALLGCLGFELGQARGQGVDLQQRRFRAYLWSAPYAGLRLAIALGRALALTLEPGLAVPLARRRFVSSDAASGVRDVLHTPAPVSGRVAFALEASF